LPARRALDPYKKKKKNATAHAHCNDVVPLRLELCFTQEHRQQGLEFRAMRTGARAQNNKGGGRRRAPTWGGAQRDGGEEKKPTLSLFLSLSA
jgi:hypothetical protein